MFAVWWPAGLGMTFLSVLLVVGLRRPTGAIATARMSEEEAWSDLAAVMEEAIHGQDDVRTSLAAPYVRKLYAQRAREVLVRGRRVCRMSAKGTMWAGAITRTLIATLAVVGAWALMTGNVTGARLTGVWLL